MSAQQQPLLGEGGAVILLTGTYNAGVTSPGTATVNFNRDGTITSTDTDGGGFPFDWIRPKSSTVGDNYTIRLHINSGTSPTGAALDSDLALTSNRSWSLSALGTYNGTWTLKQGGVTVGTATVVGLVHL